MHITQNHSVYVNVSSYHWPTGGACWEVTVAAGECGPRMRWRVASEPVQGSLVQGADPRTSTRFAVRVANHEPGNPSKSKGGLKNAAPFLKYD